MLGGGGISGKIFIEYAIKNNIRLPLAIIDSNKSIQGSFIYEVKVISLKEYMDNYYKLKIYLSVDSNNRKNIRKSVSNLDMAKNLFDFKINDLIMNYVWETHTEDVYHFMANEQEEVKIFYQDNAKRIERIYNILEDEKSKLVYNNVLKAKIENNRMYYVEVFDNDQYYPRDIFEIDNNITFVDCGAYDGDTMEEFVANTDYNYKKIICIEPNKSKFEVLKDKAKKYKNIELINKGVYSSNTTLNFEITKDQTGSYILESADEIIDKNIVSIRTLRIDDYIAEADYIKMDIEGSELEALKGSVELIKRCRPKLAVCIYHKIEHYIDIAEYILSLNLGYKLYIRHYSTYIYETVLYAI
ncbi:FkbM family methyltransferase [Peptoanaerobacter stomatis]|uniref:FkbM family methyltransferase n=1 Tax=Peptoanaerobacter stomatis TaxID=796937 RepID=UPI003F9EDE66